MSARTIRPQCAARAAVAALIVLCAVLTVGCGTGQPGRWGDLIIGQPVAGTGDTYIGTEAELVEIPPDPQYAGAAGEGEYESFDYSSEMALLVNRGRCNAGLQPVTVNSKLNAAASAHAMDMAKGGYAGPPPDPGAFIRSFGHKTQGWGMNFCGGFKDVSGFYEGWGGDANPLVTNPQFEELGYGHVTSSAHDGMAFVVLILAGTSAQPEQPTPKCSDLDFSSLETPVVTEEPSDDDFFPIQFTDAGTLTPGGSGTGSILWPDEGDIWTFDGTAGQSVAIELAATDDGLFIIELYAPDGSFVGGADTFSGVANISTTLSTTGSYEIWVYAWFPGNYTISLQ
jgi:hypothetical protein